jgi:hypothetical protein
VFFVCVQVGREEFFSRRLQFVHYTIQLFSRKMTHYLMEEDLGEDVPKSSPTTNYQNSENGCDHQLVPVKKIQPADSKMDQSPLHDLHATKALRAKPETRKKNRLKLTIRSHQNLGMKFGRRRMSGECAHHKNTGNVTVCGVWKRQSPT